MFTSNKKARVEENEGENHREETCAQGNLGNRDTEIFSTLTPLMEDLEGMKTHRFVCKSWNEFASVMSPSRMKSLQNFQLTIKSSIPYEDWNYICSRIMEIPCLKELTMRFLNHDSLKWWYMNGFKTIIEHFAETLESLTGDPLPTIQNKCFPKLREVRNGGFTSLSDLSYPLKRYPLLTKATFVHTGEDCDYSSDVVQKSGIKQFHFSYIPNLNFGNPHENIPFLGVAGALFRNVSIFSLHISGCVEFTRNTISDIYTAVPQLTSLQLGMNLKDDRILRGLAERVDDLEEEGCALDIAPRDVSLLDFANLQQLEFGPDVHITRNTLKFCLSRMFQLKYLALHLNGDVSVDDLHEFVGHLKLVTIMTCLESIDDDEFVEDTERPRIMLPSGGKLDTKSEKILAFAFLLNRTPLVYEVL